MSLSNYDYNQINAILKEFAKNTNNTTSPRREVTIPLSEYEELREKENLYYKKIELLEKIEEECELVLDMESDNWDSETLYNRIYKIYEKIQKKW